LIFLFLSFVFRFHWSFIQYASFLLAATLYSLLIPNFVAVPVLFRCLTFHALFFAVQEIQLFSRWDYLSNRYGSCTFFSALFFFVNFMESCDLYVPCISIQYTTMQATLQIVHSGICSIGVYKNVRVLGLGVMKGFCWEMW
jgi:hypothetical protein